MAIRYSGDVEIRLHHLGRGKYHAKLRAPGLRANGDLTATGRLRASFTSPEAYDVMAIRFLVMAAKQGFPVLYEEGEMVLRRTFQSPCPYRT